MAADGRIGNFATDFDASTYNPHHYGEVSDADREIAAGFIDMIWDGHPSLLGRYKEATEFGNAGTLRTACLIMPLLQSGGVIHLTDVGQPQLEAASKSLEEIRLGLPTIWDAHADAMAAKNPRWAGVLPRLGEIAIVEGPISILDAKPESTDVAVEAHVACSVTPDPEAHERVLDALFGSVRRGGVVVRLSDVGSTEYTVNGVKFEGYPETPDTLARSGTDRGFVLLGSRVVAVKQPDDALPTGSTFNALAVTAFFRPEY